MIEDEKKYFFLHIRERPHEVLCALNTGVFDAYSAHTRRRMAAPLHVFTPRGGYVGSNMHWHIVNSTLHVGKNRVVSYYANMAALFLKLRHSCPWAGSGIAVQPNSLE